MSTHAWYPVLVPASLEAGAGAQADKQREGRPDVAGGTAQHTFHTCLSPSVVLGIEVTGYMQAVSHIPKPHSAVSMSFLD